MRKKLKKLGSSCKDLRFLTKPIYERNGQTAEIQGMIHVGPKEMYEKIEIEKNKASIAVHEGVLGKFIEPDALVDNKISRNHFSKEKYQNQFEHIFRKKEDIVADMPEKELLKKISKQLTPTELEIFKEQEKIINLYESDFPNKENHDLYLNVRQEKKPESVEQKFWGKEDLPGPFSEKKIKETASLEGGKLKEALEEEINQLNLYVIGINNAKNNSYRAELLQNYKLIQATFLCSIRYIWHTNGESRKTEWLNNQILRFNDPQLNIENAYENIYIEERNHLAVSTISRINPEEHKTIHTNYGESHLSGIHDAMLQEGWKLKDIELMEIDYPKISWWKRFGENLKKPFWNFKNRKRKRELKKLIKQAKKENTAYTRSFDTEVEVLGKNGKPMLVPFPSIEDAPISEKSIKSETKENSDSPPKKT